MAHPYTELQPEYESWVAHCVIRPERKHELDQVCERLLRDEAVKNFDDVFASIAMPQGVQAPICEREDSCNFNRSPAQGDPWNEVSRHVPRGIGPFTSWKDSAIYSWTKADKMSVISVSSWTYAYACFKEEYYNGGGYRAHGRRTPYVVGGTNLQQPAKYVADGELNLNVMDTQLGCLPIMLRLAELHPAWALTASGIVVPPPSEIVTPPPAGVGGNLTGVKWVQSAANIILHPTPPLLVDGSFGRQTRAAIRDMEQLYGLPVTGIVSDALCDKIDAALAAARPQ